MVRVLLAAEAAATVRALAGRAYPAEGCGVLVGRLGDDLQVLRATSGRNLVSGRNDRYELDPGDIVAADRGARDDGLEVVGFWHSHPDHPARPSRFDSERAWPEYAYLICSVVDGTADALRAFTLEREGGDLVEVAVEDVAAPAAER